MSLFGLNDDDGEAESRPSSLESAVRQNKKRAVEEFLSRSPRQEHIKGALREAIVGTAGVKTGTAIVKLLLARMDSRPNPVFVDILIQRCIRNMKAIDAIITTLERHPLEKNAKLYDRWLTKITESNTRNMRMIRTLVKDGRVELDSWNLAEAARAKMLSLCRILLECGADVHIGDDTPYLIALQNRDFELQSLMLEHGADPHAQDKFFAWACWNMLTVQATRDMELIATPNTADRAERDEQLRQILATFEKIYGDREKKRKSVTETDLFYAVEIGDFTTVEYVYERLRANSVQFDPDEIFSERVIRKAAQLKSTDILEMLIDQGADPRMKNDMALEIALDSRNVDMVLLLLDAGADITAFPRKASFDNRIAKILWTQLDAKFPSLTT